MSAPEPLGEREALLVLNAIPHLGPVTLRRLRDHFEAAGVSGYASHLLRARESELRKVRGVGAEIAGSIRSAGQWDWAGELARLEALGGRLLVGTDSEFPALLRKIYDPPIALYARGRAIPPGPAVAVVGTRRPSQYGRAVARQVASQMGALGWCVVSGMARGIDREAHLGALEAGAATVAVLGHGVDLVYPMENRDLFERLLVEGTLVSEFPLGRRADRMSFPMRNRIVAGMAQVTLVVESDASGGSLITARLATDQGRLVAAVPGRIDQPSSRGCHQLIRDGAFLFTSVEALLEEMRFPQPELPFQSLSPAGAEEASPIPPHPPCPQRDGSQVARVPPDPILDPLREGDRLSPDELAERLGLPISAVMAGLLRLEVRGAVKRELDGRYEALPAWTLDRPPG